MSGPIVHPLSLICLPRFKALFSPKVWRLLPFIRNLNLAENRLICNRNVRKTVRLTSTFKRQNISC